MLQPSLCYDGQNFFDSGFNPLLIGEDAATWYTIDTTAVQGLVSIPC